MVVGKSIMYINKLLVDIAYNVLKIIKNIDPFLTLVFLSLPVIPNIKLTGKELFDVENFEFIDISCKKNK